MFKIVMPCYNASEYIRECIESLRSQIWTDYSAVIVDDASTDGTHQVATASIGNDARFRIIRKDNNSGALSSIVSGIVHISENPSDIIVVVDGDDYLSCPFSLDRVAYTYKRTGAWITYGSYKTVSGHVLNPDIGKRYDIATIRNSSYREAGWRASHLKTFKQHLWQQIKDDDLRDSEGHYWKTAYDLAIMLPMLEMAAERQEVIPDHIYTYRDNIRTNNHHLRPKEQVSAAKRLRSMSRYQPIA